MGSCHIIFKLTRKKCDREYILNVVRLMIDNFAHKISLNITYSIASGRYESDFGFIYSFLRTGTNSDISYP